jgi:hypothetical protein
MVTAKMKQLAAPKIIEEAKSRCTATEAAAKIKMTLESGSVIFSV